MEYDYLKLLGNLSSNAAMWVAIIAMFLLPLTDHDASFLIIFAFIVLANFVLVLMMKNWAPDFFARLPYAAFYKAGPQGKDGKPAQQNIGFRLAPLSYPKVHDEELRAFVPEYVRVDVVGNTGVLFSGNVPRGVLKQLRQAITDSLEAKQSASAQPTVQPATIAPAAGQAVASQAKALEKSKAAAARKKAKAKK
ncbi:MAG: hypothetical protein WCX64_03045 [Candidatus Micrarchaeia archaeon]